MDINPIKLRLFDLGVDRYVFKDEKGKLSPINVDNLEVYGVYLSPGLTLWLIDGTHIRQDAFNNIQPWYWGDKHLGCKFSEDTLSKIMERLR